MTALIWFGVALALLGLFGIIYSVLMIVKARRSGLNDADMRAALAKVIPVNMGALMVSVLGLIMVVIATKLGG